MVTEEKLQAGSAPRPQQGQHTMGDESRSLPGARGNSEEAKEAANPQHVDENLFYDAQEGMQDAPLVIRAPVHSYGSHVTVFHEKFVACMLWRLFVQIGTGVRRKPRGQTALIQSKQSELTTRLQWSGTGRQG